MAPVTRSHAVLWVWLNLSTFVVWWMLCDQTTEPYVRIGLMIDWDFKYCFNIALIYNHFIHKPVFFRGWSQRSGLLVRFVGFFRFIVFLSSCFLIPISSSFALFALLKAFLVSVICCFNSRDQPKGAWTSKCLDYGRVRFSFKFWTVFTDLSEAVT